MKSYMKRYRSVAIAELSSTESDSNSSSEDTDPTYALSDNATVAFPDLCQLSDHRLDSASEYGDDMLPDDSESNDDGMDIDCSPRLSTTDVVADLAGIVTHYNLPRKATNDLLELLRKSGRFNKEDIPKDAKTILGTPRHVDVVKKCGGEYVYFGIQHWITSLFENRSNNAILQQVSIDVNIDGIPIQKSSNLQLWPILCSLVGIDIPPFCVAIFCGDKKPDNVTEYLDDFVNEAISLIQNGVIMKDKMVPFCIRAFFCDAPARAFLKQIIGHTGKHACERCCIVGKSVERRMVFLTDFNDHHCLRTDAQFRTNGYPQHKLHDSPLFSIPDFNMISGFVLDSMHLLFLGICRRFLFFLKAGPRAVRLSQMLLLQMSEKLVDVGLYTPSEFARQPRGLNDLERFKATELRQFVLYHGIVCLKGIVRQDVYELFLSFFVAVRILHLESATQRNRLLPAARDMFRAFVHNAPHVLTETFVTYNVHSVLHICDDVELYEQPLSALSCFKFENYLQTLKRLIRDARQSPLVSLVKRLQERTSLQQNVSTRQHSLKINLTRRDRFFIDTKGRYCEVCEIHGKGDNRTLTCHVISQTNLRNYFEKSIKSSAFGIYTCDSVALLKRKLVVLPISNVKQKLYAIGQNNITFFPVLSSVD
jgi:hypothetical protein